MEMVAKFESITGLSRGESIEFLEASNNKLEKAVNLYFQEQNAGSKSPAGNASQSKKRNYSRLNSNNMEENSNEPFVSVVDDDHNTNTSDSIDIDDVRAPIPQKTEKLLNYDPYALALAPQRKRMRVNAFDGYQPSSDDSQPAYAGNSSNKSKSLGALFRPPVDLLFNASFEASKLQGCKNNKWVLVNVQNQIEFNCQSLNRDVWSDDTVKEIVRENFVFIQIYCDSLDGKKLINYYNITSYPFVAILDPRTGEKLMQFNSSKIDQLMFCEKVTTFLADYDMPLKEHELASNNYSNNNTTIMKKGNSNTNEIIKVDDDEEDIVELSSNLNKISQKGQEKSHANNNTSKLNPLLTQSSKSVNSFENHKPKKANDILNSILVDDKSNDYVEVEDNDVLSTDGSNSNSSDVAASKTKSALNHLNRNNKKVKEDEDAEVNVEENSGDNDDVVTCKDKYEKEKLLKKQLGSESVNATTSKQTNDSNCDETSLNKTKTNSQPTQTRYETLDAEEKDCILRILYPNGDRLDFCTNGNAKIRVLLDYLKNQGYKKDVHELIERLMPNMKTANDNDVTNQSRNIFNSDLSLSFKQLRLYPRVFLLLQEC